MFFFFQGAVPAGAPPPYAPPGYAAPPQPAPYYPQAAGYAQPPPPPSTVVVQGGFDAGARFDGVAQPTVPVCIE